jgi:serine/threonine protein kinase
MLQEGQQLGEFEILAKLGQGGMGAVYKARQTILRRIVAIKTLQPALSSDAEFVSRFHNEAVAAAGLNHPNLVQVYAAGESDGIHWFAMEFVDGESVQARLKRLGKLEAAEALAIGMHVQTALEHGWRRGFLFHTLIGQTGRPLLTYRSPEVYGSSHCLMLSLYRKALPVP